MIGIIVDALSVALGGLVGSILAGRVPDHIKERLNWIFGICAMGMGISAAALVRNIPAMVFSVIVGTIIGLLLKIGHRIDTLSHKALKLLSGSSTLADQALFVTAVVLFCASGTGIYGSLDAGMTGNLSIILAKTVLDFFTAIIFACNLGKAVSMIAIPQFIIYAVLFLLARVIVPFTDNDMILDFKACGGLILLATGFRMLDLRKVPAADMLPAMVLILPVSSLWTHIILPLIN